MQEHQRIWEEWNASGGPKYPQEKAVQFCFRRFPLRTDRESRHALDLGCGAGVHSLFLAEEGFGVTGVDISEAGINATRNRLSTRGLTALLHVQSLAALDLPPSTYDVVLCMSVLEAAGPVAASEGLRRLPHALKPGACGLLLITAADDFRISGPNRERLHGYTRPEVEALFARGFSTVFIDEYVTTYQGGRIRQHDWLVTIEN